MRHILVPTVIVAVAIALTGCSASAGGSSSDSASESGPVAGDSTSRDNGAGLAADSAADSAEGSFADADRSVITTGYVTVVAESPVEASAEAARITEAAGGRVDARTETAATEGNDGNATLTLRIPSDTLSDTLEKLKALGDVEEVSLSSSDVTTEVQDLDARISALSASVDRLTALLATATDTDILIKLESAISERQGTLESMEAQQRSLADQVSMSSVQLNLVSPANAPVKQPETPANFVDGLAAGWGAFVGFVSFLLVALGVMLPWIVLIGAIVVVVLLLMRRAKRRTPPSGRGYDYGPRSDLPPAPDEPTPERAPEPVETR
jgi:hypothetical protein